MSKVLTREEAINALANGDAVAIGTDTVYGICASVSNPQAVAKLFAIKKRPSTVALPVMVGSLEQLHDLGISLNRFEQQLTSKFWPGPLTLLLHAPLELAQRVGSADATAGVRMPNDDELLALLRETGPLCVTSANEHGEPPCTSAADVLANLTSSQLVGVLDVGVRNSPVSSVVQLVDGTIRMLRHGALSEEKLREALS